MRKKLMTTFLGVLVIFLLGTSLSYGAYKVGDTVANFTLNDPNGISYSLYDLKGKIFVLNFWASW